MDAQFWINVLSRWIHVTSAVVGVGAIAFVRLVLLPAARAAGPEFEREVSARVLPGFKRLVHIAIGLLLLTGVYNLFVVIPKVDALGDLKSQYHSVLGVKILLALILFGVASVVLAASPADARAEARRLPLLGLTLLLAAVVLFASAILRRTWDRDPRLSTTPPAPPVIDSR